MGLIHCCYHHPSFSDFKLRSKYSMNPLMCLFMYFHQEQGSKSVAEGGIALCTAATGSVLFHAAGAQISL